MQVHQRDDEATTLDRYRPANKRSFVRPRETCVPGGLSPPAKQVCPQCGAQGCPWRPNFSSGARSARARQTCFFLPATVGLSVGLLLLEGVHWDLSLWANQGRRLGAREKMSCFGLKMSEFNADWQHRKAPLCGAKLLWPTCPPRPKQPCPMRKLSLRNFFCWRACMELTSRQSMQHAP